MNILLLHVVLQIGAVRNMLLDGNELTLDQSYFNFTVGAAFVAGAIVIICVAINNMKNNRKEQEKLIDQLQKRVNLRRRILNDSRASVWRSTGQIIQFSLDFSLQRGVSQEMAMEEFARFIHPDTLPVWNALTSNYTAGDGRNDRILVKAPADRNWHWYKVSFYNPEVETGYHYSGLFTCVDDEVERKEKETQVLAQLDEGQQDFSRMRDTIPVFRQLLRQVYNSTQALLDIDPRNDGNKADSVISTQRAAIESLDKIISTLIYKSSSRRMK